MTSGFYQKIDGAWTNVGRPYAKRSGTWRGALEAYQKTGGVWVKFWEYDNTPSTSPAIQLTHYGPYSAMLSDVNYLRVGIKLPDGSNDPDLKMIRVLTTYAGAAPTSQYGGTYTAASDSLYPSEPWSDFYYNGWGPDGFHGTGYYSASRDSSVYLYKNWTLNASFALHTKIPGGTYYFTAWSQDQDGNWSTPTQSSITIPSWGSAPYQTHNQWFYPADTGTYDKTAGTFTSGMMTQNSDPKMGAIFYGDTIGPAVAWGSGSFSWTSEQLVLHRSTDTGDAMANVYAGWGSYANAAAMDALSAGTTPSVSNIALLGTIAKGETKSFALPVSWRPYYAGGTFKSIHLWYKDPDVVDPTAADYSQIFGKDVDVASGKLALSWTVSTGSGGGGD